jgi:hypothetical protein
MPRASGSPPVYPIKTATSWLWSGKPATSHPLLRRVVAVVVTGAVVMLPTFVGQAQVPPRGGQLVTPPSGIVNPGDAGKRGHTNVEILRLPLGPAPVHPGAVTPPGSPTPGGAQGGKAEAGPAQR